LEDGEGLIALRQRKRAVQTARVRSKVRTRRRSAWFGRPALIAAIALVVGFSITACDSAQRVRTTTPRATTTTANTVVDVYSSLPLSGPQAAEGRAIQHGIRLGIFENEDDGEIDGIKVHYVPLNDADKSGWNASAVEEHAERAARDPRAVMYIGDLNSGATEVSLPILNQAGIVQITPGSAYAGLTDAVTNVTKQQEPQKFYPTGIFTLLRLVPDDMVQAAAALEALSSAPISCNRVAAIQFGSNLDGPALVSAIQVTTRDYKMTYVTTPKLASATKSAELTYAEDLKQKATQCLVVTGRTTAEAISLVKTFHTVLPTEPIVATSGLCNRQFTDSRDGGLPVALAPYVSCTSPVLPISSYGPLESKQFIAEYRQRFGRHSTPAPYAAYGYVAGELTADAILTLGFGDNRLAMQSALLGGGEHESGLMDGLYFDSHGNLSTPDRFGLFEIENGVPVLNHVLTPTKVVACAGTDPC
jgi:branched-chain amino acid transport system substrate-binding protein